LSTRIYNVLFLCIANSARSILAEAVLNHLAPSRFFGYSAGSRSKGVVHPMALQLLNQLDIPTHKLRSKSVAEFSRPDAPEMDFIFTICDEGKNEGWPIWPGTPVSGHWSIPDPVTALGGEAERMQAFRQVFQMLERRISLLVSLRHQELGPIALREKIEEIERYHVAVGK
jgi:protein-tyrosine-phosphatase